MMELQHSICYIGGIPGFYHAKHLRIFFSTFIEDRSFKVFHFRHRPESGDKSKKSKFLCVFIKVHHRFVEDFIRFYDNKHWLDESGEESISQRCKILKLTSITGSTLAKHNGYLKRSEVGKLQKRVGFSKVSSSNFIHTAESNLLEFNPPPDMPQGNVGTPTSFFVKLINECRLSGKVIKKLGLRFPRIRRSGKYSAVSYEYEKSLDNSCQTEDAFDNSRYSDNDDDNEVVAGNGKYLVNEEDYVNRESSDRERYEALEDYDRESDSIIIPANEDSNRQEDMDDDDTEEWDRFEALHDDPHNLNRGKCRRYEEELEVVWEKGGSGLVFYTDEQVWREKSQLEMFDEPTNYDWDIDTSVWYERGSGDKDAKDLVTMRLESRWEIGIDDDDAVNFFNTHEKSVARRLMEQFGWRPGERLGCVSRNGLKTALRNEGQKPSDKTGLGYYGPKLIRRMIPEKSSSDENKLSSESLYRRSDPNDIIKYRSYQNFIRGQTLNS